VLNWTAATGGIVSSSPAVVKGVVYVGSEDHKLYAFDAGGSTNCSGRPKSCAPLWTATTGGSVVSSPAVVNGVVYVGSKDGKLYAFDAAGTTNCSGAPKTCSPLWTATTAGFAETFDVTDSPTVVNGVVYIDSVFPTGSSGALYAFDAAGSVNCSGTPKSCRPLWTAATASGAFSSPAVAGGVAYVGDGGGHLYAFDAAGATNCSGSPKTCAPLWTGVSAGQLFSSPAVVNGVAYVSSHSTRAPSPANALFAFDAAGTTNCSGNPKTCTPLWTAPYVAAGFSSPGVANGVVYIEEIRLDAFDAAGATNCSGSPKICKPLFSGSTNGSSDSSPAVVNGVVDVGGSDNKLYAFDAAGTTNCSGSPKNCTPLFSATTGGIVSSSPAVVDGVVYVGAGDSKLYAFGLEKIPPTTSVVIPSNGKTVSGTSLLDASASDDVSVSKVEFHLTSERFTNKLIGVATRTQYGWLFNWDTTSVPNDDYTLNSVATDPAGNVGRSASVSITVAN
jgi:outer membrane protein assembly factor BamB